MAVTLTETEASTSQHVSTSQIRELSVTEDDMSQTEYGQETRSLRFLLRLFFFWPLHWSDCYYSINLIHSVFSLVQLLKLICTTVVMFQFGRERGEFIEVVQKGHLVLRHLLLKDWDASWETLPYPPSHGDFAVYDINVLEEKLNFAVRQFYSIPEKAAGYYKLTDEDMHIDLECFSLGGFNSSNSTGIKVEQFGFTVTPPPIDALENFTVMDDFKKNNLTYAIKNLLKLDLMFGVYSLRIEYNKLHAWCVHIAGKVLFEDQENNGQVVIDLETLTTRIDCDTIEPGIPSGSLGNSSNVFAVFTLVCVCLSVIQVLVITGLALITYRKTKSYMRKHFTKYFHPTDENEKDLSHKEYRRFIKHWCWELAVFVSDVLIITSLVQWITIENSWTVAALDSLSVRLSLGNIIAWITLLKYFRFHNKFDLLLSTLYGAFWDVFAFLLCITIVFMAFWACGFVVLGPYHVKFSTPSLAMETLFGISIGDELFATLAMLDDKQSIGNTVRTFSRFYICAYVSIFTIVAINLLIAIFNSAYESIKNRNSRQAEEHGSGSLEKALRRYLRHDSSQPLRTLLCDILVTRSTEQEDQLCEELSKFVHPSVNGSDVEVIQRKPRKLKTFILDNTLKDDTDDESCRSN